VNVRGRLNGMHRYRDTPGACGVFRDGVGCPGTTGGHGRRGGKRGIDRKGDVFGLYVIMPYLQHFTPLPRPLNVKRPNTILLSPPAHFQARNRCPRPCTRRSNAPTHQRTNAPTALPWSTGAVERAREVEQESGGNEGVMWQVGRRQSTSYRVGGSRVLGSGRMDAVASTHTYQRRCVCGFRRVWCFRNGSRRFLEVGAWVWMRYAGSMHLREASATAHLQRHGA
jgi:hypothetical protein